jgi:hypothetical protein
MQSLPCGPPIRTMQVPKAQVWLSTAILRKRWAREELFREARDVPQVTDCCHPSS